MVKVNPFVTSQPRKVRKQLYTATKDEKHRFLSCHLSKELQETHGIKSLPVARNDEVKLMCGSQKGRDGKVTDVKLSSMRIYIDSVTKDKVNGQTIKIPVHPSNCIITKLNMSKHREQLIKKKKEGRDRLKAKLAAK